MLHSYAGSWGREYLVFVFKLYLCVHFLYLYALLDILFDRVKKKGNFWNVVIRWLMEREETSFTVYPFEFSVIGLYYLVQKVLCAGVIKKGFLFSILLFWLPKSSFISSKEILHYWHSLLVFLAIAKCSIYRTLSKHEFQQEAFCRPPCWSVYLRWPPWKATWQRP